MPVTTVATSSRVSSDRCRSSMQAPVTFAWRSPNKDCMDNTRLIRILTIAALAIALVLQLQLWFGEGSRMHVYQLRKEIAAQQETLARLRARNEILEAQVRSLKENLDTVEGLARGDLGMIRRGETFFLVTEPEDEAATEPQE